MKTIKTDPHSREKIGSESLSLLKGSSWEILSFIVYFLLQQYRDYEKSGV